MKKFISKLVLFLTIIATMTALVNFIFIKMDKSDKDCTNKFKNIPDRINICNFGSSHGLYGFNYEDIESKGYSCFNFGLTAQPLSYDYRLLQQYGNHIGEGTIVFIPISYFSFFGNKEDNDALLELMNKRYYDILSPKLIKNYDIETDIYVNYLPALSVESSVLIKTMLGKGETSEVNEYDWRRVASDIDILADAEDAYYRHVAKIDLDDDRKRISNQQEIEALYGLVDSCREAGAIPILVTTPYLAEYTNKIQQSSPDFFDDFYAVLDKIIDATGIDYYDYATDERFVYRYDWFMNVDHLNKDGAKNFTNILLEEISMELN